MFCGMLWYRIAAVTDHTNCRKDHSVLREFGLVLVSVNILSKAWIIQISGTFWAYVDTYCTILLLPF